MGGCEQWQRWVEQMLQLAPHSCHQNTRTCEPGPVRPAVFSSGTSAQSDQSARARRTWSARLKTTRQPLPDLHVSSVRCVMTSPQERLRPVDPWVDRGRGSGDLDFIIQLWFVILSQRVNTKDYNKAHLKNNHLLFSQCSFASVVSWQQTRQNTIHITYSCASHTHTCNVYVDFRSKDIYIPNKVIKTQNPSWLACGW